MLKIKDTLMENFEQIKSLLEQEIADDEKLKNGELDVLLEIAIRGDIAYRNTAYKDFIYNHAQFAVCNKGKFGHYDDEEIINLVREWAIFKLLYEFKIKDSHENILNFVVKVLSEELEDAELVNKTALYVKTLTPPAYLLSDFFLSDLRAKSYDNKCYPEETCKSIYSKFVHDLAKESPLLAKEFISEVSKNEDMEYLKCINFVYNEEFKKEDEELLSRDERILLTDAIFDIIENYDINENTLIFSDDDTISESFNMLKIKQKVTNLSKELKSVTESIKSSSTEISEELNNSITEIGEHIEDIEYDNNIDKDVVKEIIESYKELVSTFQKETKNELDYLYDKAEEWEDFSEEEIERFEWLKNAVPYNDKTSDKIYDIENFIEFQDVQNEFTNLKETLLYNDYTDKIKKKYNKAVQKYFGLRLAYSKYLNDAYDELEEIINEKKGIYYDNNDYDDDDYYDDEEEYEDD